MYRYKWNLAEQPNRLTDHELVEKYNFYKFVQKWAHQPDNELLDKIQDLAAEIHQRNTLINNI